MATVKRWVCAACKAAWFQPDSRGLCPNCHGPGEEQNVTLRADGSVDVGTD